VAVAAIPSLPLKEEERDWVDDVWLFITGLPKFAGHWIGKVLGALFDLIKIKEVNDGMLEWLDAHNRKLIEIMFTVSPIEPPSFIERYEKKQMRIHMIAFFQLEIEMKLRIGQEKK
jgi:hypothetical protein